MPRTDGIILARWQGRLENADCSPLEFFDLAQMEISEKGLPNLRFSQIVRREGGWFSPQRVYLRIRCRRLYFDVSAFVVGNTLILGWWLHEDAPGVADLLAELPGIGFLMGKTTHAVSYYTVDFIEYFQRAVHESILRVVDRLSEEAGLEPLSDEARQPIWEEIW